MNHDPMCWYADQDRIPAAAVNDGWPCVCDLIARVRDDERAAARMDAAKAIAAIPKEDGGYCHVLHACDVEAAIEALGGDRGNGGVTTAIISGPAADRIREALGGER